MKEQKYEIAYRVGRKVFRGGIAADLDTVQCWIEGIQKRITFPDMYPVQASESALALVSQGSITVKKLTALYPDIPFVGYDFYSWKTVRLFDADEVQYYAESYEGGIRHLNVYI